MRSIFIFAMLGTLLFLPQVGLAEIDAECQSVCADDKAARNADCQTGEDTDDPQAHVQCLIESQRAYNSCLSGCVQSAPTETSTEN